MLIAIRDPLQIPINIMSQKFIKPVKSRIPMIKVSRAFASWLYMISFFVDILSARAPPKGEITVIGRAKARVTMVNAKGESPVTLKTNQLLVIICIFMAKNERNEPIHSHLKSL